MNLNALARSVLQEVFTKVKEKLPLPDAPTIAAPGTPNKLAIMETRKRRKQQLFHPADAKYEGDTRPLVWLRKATRGLKPGKDLIRSKYFNRN
jgi:hypothetical protein